MQAIEAQSRFRQLEDRQSVEEYNFEHFRTRHLLFDATGTMEKRGILPGEPAPDFELPSVSGPSVRLSSLRDKPVLLRFGSFT